MLIVLAFNLVGNGLRDAFDVKGKPNSMGENAELDFFKKRLRNTESLLMLKQRQIDSVLEITRAITQNLPLIALARTLQATIYAQLGISKSALLIKSKNGSVLISKQRVKRILNSESPVTHSYLTAQNI